VRGDTLHPTFPNPVRTVCTPLIASRPPGAGDFDIKIEVAHGQVDVCDEPFAVFVIRQLRGFIAKTGR
jgi:hypothetical protein